MSKVERRESSELSSDCAEHLVIPEPSVDQSWSSKKQLGQLQTLGEVFRKYFVLVERTQKRRRTSGKSGSVKRQTTF